MRYLGLDFGSRRIGVAVSDEEGRIAFPREVVEIKNRLEAAEKIKNLTNKEKVKKIILGLPHSLQGSDTSQTREVREFARILQEKISIPLEFEDEMLTSKIAARSTARNKIDASAAALLLQTYLDKHEAENQNFKF